MTCNLAKLFSLDATSVADYIMEHKDPHLQRSQAFQLGCNAYAEEGCGPPGMACNVAKLFSLDATLHAPLVDGRHHVPAT